MKLNVPLIPVLVVGLLVIKLLDPFPGWTILLVGLGGAWLTSWLWARGLAKHLRLKREMRFGWAQVGDKLEERFTLINHFFLPALWVEVFDHTNMPGYSSSAATGVGGEGENSWVSEGICSQRGLYHHGPTTIKTGDPLGIYTIEISDPRSAQLMVLPPVLPLLNLAIQVGGQTGLDRTRLNALERSVNVAGVRPYVPGDQLRWIDWKTTAHRSEMVVRLFESAIAADWFIILDLDQATQDGVNDPAIFEHAIILASSLSRHALQEGRGVGLAVNSSAPTWLLPRHGQGQQWEILRTLALASPGACSIGAFLAGLPGSIFRRTGLVVVTANLQDNWLQSLILLMRGGADPFVFLLDPTEYGGSQQAASCTGSLARLGIPHQVMARPWFNRPEARPGERGQRRWRVTPFGRAVPQSAPADQDWKVFS